MNMAEELQGLLDRIQNEGIAKDEAEKIKKQLEAAGAKVELK